MVSRGEYLCEKPAVEMPFEYIIETGSMLMQAGEVYDVKS